MEEKNSPMVVLAGIFTPLHWAMAVSVLAHYVKPSIELSCKGRQGFCAIIPSSKGTEVQPPTSMQHTQPLGWWWLYMIQKVETFWISYLLPAIKQGTSEALARQRFRVRPQGFGNFFSAKGKSGRPPSENSWLMARSPSSWVKLRSFLASEAVLP